MSAEDLPFFSGWLPGFVENFGWDAQLANVMEQRTPAQTVELGLRQAHLLTNDICISTHALGMASGLRIVLPEMRNQQQSFFGGSLRRAAQAQGRFSHEPLHRPGPER